MSSRSRSRRPESKKRKYNPTNSFAPLPTASRSTIHMPEPHLEPPVFRGYLCAFCAVLVLVLFGGGQHVVALGLALILPGLALYLVPPKTGLGKLGDFGVLGLLLVLLFAFLPQFYWPTADWRVVAGESLGIDLPGVLSVQPWISFEAWLLLLAGVAWLYVALQFPINLSGRRRLFFYVSILFAAMAGLVVWGNLMGLHYPGAGDAGTFSFFPDRNQTANFLALGGGGLLSLMRWRPCV